jgi:predicted phosphodiesterase
MTKLGLIGDIHAEDVRLETALRLFRAEGVDQTLFVGDVVDGEGDVDRCCALLADAGALGVRGNHDRWLLEGTMRSLPHAHARDLLAPRSVALLESLPVVREIQTARGALLLCHGVGENDMQRLGPDDEGYALETNDALTALIRSGRYAVAVGGHTHARMVRRFGALVFVNAGTLAPESDPCCAVLDIAAARVGFFELEEPTVARASGNVALLLG